MRRSFEKRLRRLERYFGIGEPVPDFTAMAKPKPLLDMLNSVQAKKAFMYLDESLAERHVARIDSDFDKPQPGALSYYIARWARDHAAGYAMDPFVIPEKLADWLLELPDQLAGYHPFDVCWDCGCYYPMFYHKWHPAKPAYERHPWVGRKCLLCGGWIVDPERLHLSWRKIDSAPFSVKRRKMESE